MKYKKNIWQTRLAPLLMLVLLLTPLTPSRAGTAAMPLQQAMSAGCKSMSAVSVKRIFCDRDCQHQLTRCFNSCFAGCTVTAINMLPVSALKLSPFYYITTTHQLQIYTPVGRAMDVLDRPPRQIS